VRWSESLKGELHEVGQCTRWFKYDRDKLWLVYTQIVPVIFELPCTCQCVIKVCLNTACTLNCINGISFFFESFLLFIVIYNLSCSLSIFRRKYPLRCVALLHQNEKFTRTACTVCEKRMHNFEAVLATISSPLIDNINYFISIKIFELGSKYILNLSHKFNFGVLLSSLKSSSTLTSN
jgi:hypothetical protein